WSTWDRAAAASDYVGIQGMRGSTHETGAQYENLYNATLVGAKRAHDLFARPVIVDDVALSSYPAPEYVDMQAAQWQRFFDGLPELQAAGVDALIARAWFDDPHMDLANYYGEAERHWGFVDPVTQQQKPSAAIWIDGVTRERARSVATATTGDIAVPDATALVPAHGELRARWAENVTGDISLRVSPAPPDDTTTAATQESVRTQPRSGAPATIGIGAFALVLAGIVAWRHRR